MESIQGFSKILGEILLLKKGKESQEGLVLKTFEIFKFGPQVHLPISPMLFFPYISYIILLFLFCLYTFKASIQLERALEWHRMEPWYNGTYDMVFWSVLCYDKVFDMIL